MTAETAIIAAASEPTSWDRLTVRAPLLAATMRRYIAQQRVTLAPSTIQAINNTLVRFGLWVVEHDPNVRGAGDIGRAHIEAFKLKCITDVHFATGEPLSPNTVRQRLRLLKVFFDRIIDWEFVDAPRRNPIIRGDVPPRPEPLPKFLDDEAMAAFMHQAEIEPDPLRKLCVLLLARTAMRVGELCNLAADPVVEVGDNHWLHVPVGKLRNDRYIPLHPTLVELIGEWQAVNAVHIARTGRLLTDDVSAVDRHRVTRMVRRIAKRAGVGHVHPHQLRHTLATQAINRGMRLEAVAALLGHKNLEMTMVYARIADDTVAEEYFDITNQVDQLYANARNSPPTGTRTMNFDIVTPTPIELSRAEALVIFDWLSRHEDAGTTPGDDAEKTALNSLNAALERTLVEPFQTDYNEIVQAAKAQLTNDSSPT
jgi:integrase